MGKYVCMALCVEPNPLLDLIAGQHYVLEGKDYDYVVPSIGMRFSREGANRIFDMKNRMREIKRYVVCGKGWDELQKKVERAERFSGTEEGEESVYSLYFPTTRGLKRINCFAGDVFCEFEGGHWLLIEKETDQSRKVFGKNKD